MMQALQCNEPEERQNDFVLCMSRLTPYEKNKEISNENLQKEKLNLHGTLMLQTMLEFNKPIKIITSILSMDAEVVKNLFSNSMGSHIVDSFVKSESVGEKSREKLIQKLAVSFIVFVVNFCFIFVSLRVFIRNWRGQSTVQGLLRHCGV